MVRSYAVTSVYRPTLWDHEQGNALVRRLYKRWCGISRFSKEEAHFVPPEDSRMGLMDARTRWALGVQREWIWSLYQALDQFGNSSDEYLSYVRRRWGGGPAVILL